MPKLEPFLLRPPDEMLLSLCEAAAKLGYPRGPHDKGGALFARQAIAEKITKVLGKRPTLPVHVPTRDKHKQKERK